MIHMDGYRQHLVSYLYGLIRRVFYLFFVSHIYNVIVPLVQHRFISKSPIMKCSNCTQIYQ